MRSIRILLDRLIDYAGLFPPAGLPMEQAVRHYSDYLNGRYSWILGRFVVPVSRLAEFERAVSGLACGSGAVSNWGLSALAGTGLEAELKNVSDFNGRRSRARGPFHLQIDALEIRTAVPEDVDQAARLVPPGLPVYFEVPWGVDPAPFITQIAHAGARAKMRTAGLTPDSIAPVADVARFMSACSAAKIPFKATAGLHHPVRSVRHLGHEREGPTGVMHGFLNVFLASALLHSGLGLTPVMRLLEEEDAGAFHFDDEGVSWRACRIGSDLLADTRRRFAVSFGSCSLEEPLEDLRLLRFLD